MPHGMDLSDLLATKLGKNRFPAKKSGRESLEDFCFGLSPRHSGLGAMSRGLASGIERPGTRQPSIGLLCLLGTTTIMRFPAPVRSWTK